jgi:hypothetical protein
MAHLEEVIAVTPADLVTWFKLKAKLAKIKGEEAMLRSRIFKFYFPTPTEGSKDNKVPLNDGTGAILQADHVINRTVDEQQLEALKEAMFAEGSNLPQFDLTKLIKWKPELAKTEYNKLTTEEKQIFDRCLVVKPGSPQLDIKIPKTPA